MYALLMVFKVFQSCSLPYTIINFLFSSSLLILKILTETLLIILFSVISHVMFSSVGSSLDVGKMDKN
jgi:hypothetical protein